jgi:hypothetical protein
MKIENSVFKKTTRKIFTSITKVYLFQALRPPCQATTTAEGSTRPCASKPTSQPAQGMASGPLHPRAARASQRAQPARANCQQEATPRQTKASRRPPRRSEPAGGPTSGPRAVHGAAARLRGRRRHLRRLHEGH